MKTNHQPSDRFLSWWTGLLPLLVLAAAVGLESCQRQELAHVTGAGVKVPEEVQRYLTALAASDLAAQRAAFSKEAVIMDEMGSHRAEAEIQQWLAHFNAVQMRVEVLGSSPIRNGHTLLMRWTPHQAQHQWIGYYTFEYQAGRIARLHIGSENPPPDGDAPNAASLAAE